MVLLGDDSKFERGLAFMTAAACAGTLGSLQSGQVPAKSKPSRRASWFVH